MNVTVTVRAVYKLLLGEGGANAQSMREKIALVSAALQRGANNISGIANAANPAITGWIRAILPTY